MFPRLQSLDWFIKPEGLIILPLLVSSIVDVQLSFHNRGANDMVVRTEATTIRGFAEALPKLRSLSFHDKDASLLTVEALIDTLPLLHHLRPLFLAFRVEAGLLRCISQLQALESFKIVLHTNLLVPVMGDNTFPSLKQAKIMRSRLSQLR